MSHRKSVLVVGAGMAGLTAAAYLLRKGYSVRILERGDRCGGLVHSFWKKGFLFDTGPRALGNAGILLPMLQDLGLELPLVKGEVSTGIASNIVHYDSRADLESYFDSLKSLFPESVVSIHRIARDIRICTRDAAVLNKVPNPLFKSVFADLPYLFGALLPWMPSFLRTLGRMRRYSRSMEEALDRLTDNPSLKDMISQHFFKGTPANFAFGFFENFQDYLYPRGGTGQLSRILENHLRDRGADIRFASEAFSIDPVNRSVTEQNGNVHAYDSLLWAADLKSLYRRCDLSGLGSHRRRAAESERSALLSTRTGESVFSLFLAVNEVPERFAALSRGHFIYTPQTQGLGSLHRSDQERLKKRFPGIPKEELFRWLDEFCRHNSYEISIPVLKDSDLAPPGQTGLIVSLLVDGELFRLVDQAGWYTEFKKRMSVNILKILGESLYPFMKPKILFSDTASPRTLSRLFAVENGAITGWTLEEEPPVPHRLERVFAVPKTALPHIYKAGQWSYSPAGVPIAILTGRVAAALM